MKRPAVKFALLAGLALCGAVFLRWLGTSGYLDEEGLKEWIEGYGVWAPLVYILIYTIAPVFFIPGLPLTVVGGIVFGPLWGVVYASVGATLGASSAFLVARYMGREWVEERIKGTRLEELDREVKKQGWKIVAITRLVPLLPFNLLNYAFGLTGIRFSHYAVASFLFMLPGVIGYVFFSSSLFSLIVSGRPGWGLLAGLVLVVLIVIPVLYRKRFK